MSGKFRSKLSYANVMASLAVFLAAGGGYALATTGSGSIPRGTLKGLPSGHFAKVMNVPGVGTVRAKCTDPNSVPTGLAVRFRNGSGRLLNVSITEPDGLTGIDHYLSSGASSVKTEIGSATVRYHVFPAGKPATSSARPQAEITASTSVQGGSCATEQVSAIATSTQP